MQRVMSKMKNITTTSKAICLLMTFSIIIVSCHKDEDNNSSTAGSGTNFNRVNLVSNSSQDSGARVDANLVNGWGIAFSPTGNPWISSEAAGVSVVYDAAGNEVLPPVSIPSASANTGGHPTGSVFNTSTTAFMLPGGGVSRFIFAGDDGVISAWGAGTAAERVVDNSATASYTGITIANDSSGTFLYAANFKQSKIDVFDSTFAAANKTFADPGLPEGYSPFNIQNIGGQLYVMYAKLGSDGDEEKGAGLGYVDIYKPDGTLVGRFASQGDLNAPWGVAMAPAGFLDGNNSNVILVGNFGDGHINAYSPDAKFIGQLSSNGTPIVIDGLWGISFAPSSASTIPSTRLFFAAGPNDEANGLFGYIDK
jgi:uncharacterized protein (TIGR03118 family)